MILRRSLLFFTACQKPRGSDAEIGILFMTMNLNWPVLNFALEEIMISGGVLMLQKLDKRVGYLAQFKKNKSLSPMIA